MLCEQPDGTAHRHNRPDRQGGQVDADPGGLGEQSGQPPHLRSAVRSERWLQVGEVAGVLVRIMSPGADERAV